MTEWQQGLDKRLVQRLQQPLNRKNMGQVLVDRTDKFLTRFSLVEQQFQRWGKFQESNPSAVPVVYAKPTEDPLGFATPLSKADNGRHEGMASETIALSSPSGLSSGSQSDLVIQRRFDPTASAENTGLVEKNNEAIVLTSLVDQPVSDGQIDLIIQQPSDPPGFATPLDQGGKVESQSSYSVDLPLVENPINLIAADNLQVTKGDVLSGTESESSPSPQEPISNLIAISEAPKPIAENTSEVVVLESELLANTTHLDLPLIQNNLENSVDASSPSSDAPEKISYVASLPVSEQSVPMATVALEQGEKQTDDLELTLKTTPTSEQNQVSEGYSDRPASSEKLVSAAIQQTINQQAQSLDLPLVFALPNVSSTEIFNSETLQNNAQPEPLPIVKARLEQLLKSRRSPSKLPTVQPQALSRQIQISTETPLVQPLQQEISVPTPVTSQTMPSVQPQRSIPATQADSSRLPLTQAQTIQTQGRSPTSPSTNNPIASTNPTQTQVVTPDIIAAQNPVTETFQAAMEQAAQNQPVDIQAIAAQVEKKLRRKMVIERERRGQGRWR
ncbi:hypothetical protein Lepto7376_0628 [[Leptolyngbya] sp. PCC 7376]|uniref:hypothetical protein n=1 Tax=[Leptolyngbya] sp. PCC 7376 TaxID=111781 RepID=UPI00029F31A5|nr:hypothetical protein [[Leptolyngbya] sp. PCC 7376]AFY37039.1 hypothetical protein Lepto7376_0628 [[Leptolyngbya] sp. PCC 7376]